jgi:hypothetical protein
VPVLKSHPIRRGAVLAEHLGDLRRTIGLPHDSSVDKKPILDGCLHSGGSSPERDRYVPSSIRVTSAEGSPLMVFCITPHERCLGYIQSRGRAAVSAIDGTTGRSSSITAQQQPHRHHRHWPPATGSTTHRTINAACRARVMAKAGDRTQHRCGTDRPERGSQPRPNGSTPAPHAGQTYKLGPRSSGDRASDS